MMILTLFPLSESPLSNATNKLLAACTLYSMATAPVKSSHYSVSKSSKGILAMSPDVKRHHWYHIQPLKSSSHYTDQAARGLRTI